MNSAAISTSRGQSNYSQHADVESALRLRRWTFRREQISVSVFGINRIDRTAPRAVVFLQQLLRRRGAVRQTILQHFQVARLVAAADIEMLAPRQPGARQLERVSGELEHRAAANF